MSKNIPGYVSLTVHELGIIEYVAGEEAPRKNFKNHNGGGRNNNSRRGGGKRRGGGGGGNPNFMRHDRHENQINYDDQQPGQQMNHQSNQPGGSHGPNNNSADGSTFRLPRGKFRGQGSKPADAAMTQPEVSSTASEA